VSSVSSSAYSYTAPRTTSYASSYNYYRSPTYAFNTPTPAVTYAAPTYTQTYTRTFYQAPTANNAFYPSQFTLKPDAPSKILNTPEGNKIYFIEEGGYNNNPTGALTGAGKKTSKITNSYTAYYIADKWIKMWTINTSGYFIYNNNEVKAYLDDSWYTRGLFNIWQVDNWEEGTRGTGDYQTFYGRGNFHFGIEINKLGLVMGDIVVEISVTSDEDGNINKYLSFKFK